MKILLYDETPAYFCHGGKQVHAESLHNALRRLGIDVEYARWWDPNQRCDVFHMLGYTPAIVSTAREAGAKVVFTHIVDDMTNSSRSRRAFHRARNACLRRFFPRTAARLFPWHALPSMDALVYMHNYDAETAIEVYGVPREKTHIVPHGCGAEQMAMLQGGSRQRRSYLVSVGSIVPRKNTVLLASAAKRARVPVVFLGKPYSDKDRYYRQFLDLVDGECVVYRGYVADEEKASFLRGASGFVLLSNAESGCIAVYEAAAACLPMLLSARPWARVYGAHGGIQQVDLGELEPIAQRLSSFFTSAIRLETPTFPVLSWDAIAEEYAKIYKALLST